MRIDDRCKNCGTALAAEYCPSCGQRNVDLERPLVELVGEVLRESFDFDGRAFRTIWTLIRWPGLLTTEFLAGYRKKYTPPFRLYLVISILFFLVVTLIAGRGILLGEGQDLQTDALDQARLLGDDLPKLMFILLPVFALLLKAAFRGRLYFDHLIYSLHLHCASYLVLALMLPLEKAAGEHWHLAVVQVLLLIWLLSYLVLSMRRVYLASWVATGYKSFAILLGYLVLIAGAVEAVDTIGTT